MLSKRAVGLLVLIGAVSAIAFFTLGPGSSSASLQGGRCCSITDFWLNIILFVPLGVGLGLIGVSPLRVAVVGILASASIELAQLWLPGRFSSINDVVSNGTGTILGALVVAGWANRAHWWRVVGPFGAGAALIGWFAGSFLVAPAKPNPQTWYGFWAHQFRNSVQFEGQVLELTVQGLSVPDGPFKQSQQLNSRLAAADTITLATSLRSGPPVRGGGRAQLVGAMEEALGEYFVSLWQEGRSLIAFVHLRLADFGLRTTIFRLDDALPEAPGEPVDISLRVMRSQIEIETRGPSVTSQRTFPLSSDLFWAGWLPIEHDVGTKVPLWPLIPMALSWAAVGMGLRSRVAVVVGAMVALFAEPLAAGTAFPPWTAWAAALVGTMGGWLLAKRLRLWSRTPPHRRGIAA